MRPGTITLRRRVVTPLGLILLGSLVPLALLGLASVGGLSSVGHAEEAEAPPTPEAVTEALRVALRATQPPEALLAAVRQALAAPAWAESGVAVRAAARTAVRAADPAMEELALTLLLRALDHGYLRSETRAEARAELPEDLEAAAPVVRAVALAVGVRPIGPAAEALLQAAADREAAGRPALTNLLVREYGSEPSRSAFVAAQPAAAALDRADRDEAVAMAQGMQALLDLGAKAQPFLIAFVDRALEDEVPAGRVERATRAILALGELQRTDASVNVLMRALDGPNGWLRVYAATALADLDATRAAWRLARRMTITGDPLRELDQWEYPGSTETTITEEAWRRSAYYNVDITAATALLRMGVPGAAGWVLHQRLDPRKRNWRIRVFQDAVDALVRSIPSMPAKEYNVDSGLPQRLATYRKLSAWWQAHRNDAGITRNPTRLDDEGFRIAGHEVAEVLGKTNIREKMAARASCDILGGTIVPGLLEALAQSESTVQQAEVAVALGRCADARAIPALTELTREGVDFVRAAAAEGLGAFVADHPEVEVRLLELLRSRSGAVRTRAIQSLTRARPSPALQETLARLIEYDDKRVADGKASIRSPDFRQAEVLVRLMQEGMQHWPDVRAGLESERPDERVSWWTLLGAALDLAPHLFDAGRAPGDPLRQRPDAATIEAARRAWQDASR